MHGKIIFSLFVYGVLATQLGNEAMAISIVAPSAGTLIPNPGNAKDPYPYIGQVLIDNDPGVPFEPKPACTGTLIAPKLVVTAAHCLENIRDRTVENPKVAQVDFGALGKIEVTEWKMHPKYKTPTTVPRDPTEHDIAWLVLKTAPTTTPIPIPRTALEQEDVLRHVGFGFNKLNEIGPKKAWGPDKIDKFTEKANDGFKGLIRFDWSGMGTDALTQSGDSGGPGLFATRDNLGDADTIKQKSLQSGAYLSGWDTRGRDVFAASALQGNSGFAQFATPLNERVSGAEELNFLLNAMPLPGAATDINIVHNLSADPRSLLANAPQGILVSVRYKELKDFVFSPLLWEEDGGEEKLFDGFMVFGSESGDDDLAGFGYAAGALDGAGWVHAWDFTNAGSLAQMDEHILEGNLDWMLEFLTTEGPIAFDLTNSIKPSSLADLTKAILLAQDEIGKGNAVKGAIDLFQVPEPTSFSIFALALVGLGFMRRNRAA